jgi:hypothetical protein
MTLEKQVCSLGIAKRLQELGVKQNAYQAWVENTSDHSFHLWNEELRAFRGIEPKIDLRRRVPKEYSAFSVAELGEILPQSIIDPSSVTNEKIYFSQWQNGERDLWNVGYSTYDRKLKLQEFSSTEADARARMLVYLLENNLISVPAKEKK